MATNPTFLPRTDAEWSPWLSTMYSNLVPLATTLGYTTARMATVKEYVDGGVFYFGTYLPGVEAFKLQVTQTRKAILDGSNGAMADVPSMPVLPGAVAQVVCGMRAFFAQMEADLMGNPACTLAMRTVLGFIPKKKPKPDPLLATPKLTLKTLPGGMIKGRTARLGHTAVDLFIRVFGTTTFVYFKSIYTENFTYTIVPTAPGVFPSHEIFARFRDGDTLVGLPSGTQTVQPKA